MRWWRAPTLIIFSLHVAFCKQPTSIEDLVNVVELQGKLIAKGLNDISQGIGHKCEVPESTTTGNLDIQHELLNLKREVLQVKQQLLACQANEVEKPDSKPVIFNAYTSKRLSCHNCIIGYENTHVDSHSAMNLHTGEFISPKSGHYFFQFHALVESGSEAQVELMVNDKDILCIYDRDIGSGNRRYAMIGQSMIHRLELGDIVKVRLHSGTLKGGGEATFTSFLGMLVAAAENDNEML
ncbi:hypothetical protein TCAL_06932 [Tigriopus californicus]|uniref:C1q domain-containing protein n=1 Tax=Tigriopus californicus TaxID=6832 RepID=A0A553NT47_TIGCA|nr:cerebellin-1-like [Tigriopus californicus]TRY68593.1 hypothetical protein TCAL_06932 [Tigriopus californicus]|eukprot:TCALIF_06932-PA protein Name:"Protein of unknown function" AED:0.21 eAED:0.22 QI:0/-1/0/1/-1/1/1/0/238